MTSTTQASSLWLGRRKLVPHARLRLFCFPYAGGTAQIYRQWPDYLPTDVEVCSIQLPGRGSQLQQPAFTRLLALVEPLTETIARHLDKPFVKTLAESPDGTVWAGSVSEGLFHFKDGKLLTINASSGIHPAWADSPESWAMASGPINCRVDVSRVIN